MPTESQTPDTQTIQGPDQKWYKVKKSDMDKFDQHFTKKGWIKKDGKWFTQSGEEAKISVPSGTPGFVSKGTPSGLGLSGPRVGVSIEDRRKNMGTGAQDYIGASLPTIFGGIGGTIGKTPGAAIGGATGQILKTIMVRPSFMEQDPTFKKQAMDVLIEAGKQAALEKVGQKTGDLFFNILNKVPHAVIKNGIKLLPSEIKPGGTVYRYVEDLLSNLAPSAATMEAFKTKRDTVIKDKLEKMAQGFGRFTGTSEEMGILLQQALDAGKENASNAIETLRKSLPKGKQTMSEVAKQFPDVYRDWIQTWNNQLVTQVLKTNKPELIAGMLRTSKSSLNETRIMGDVLHEISPEMLGKVQNRILRDVLQETITGSKDPVAKTAQGMTQRFAGDRFKKVLDGIGEEKLKAIYGEQGYKRLEDFVKLTGQVGTGRQGSGVGRFLNLMFLLPIRSGLKVEGLMKTGGMAFALNRAAKIMTSTEGMKLYEGYVRAIGSNSPRLVNLAVDEIRKFNERSDEEFAIEQAQQEAEYEEMDRKHKEGNKKQQQKPSAGVTQYDSTALPH